MLLIRRFWFLPVAVVVLFFYCLYRLSGNSAPIPIYSEHLKITKERYPVASLIPLPKGSAKALPPVQHDFTNTPEYAEQKEIRLERAAAVKNAFLHSWNGYTQYAWTHDEVMPLSGAYLNPFGGWGASLVDSMDTLWILGLKDDFRACVAAVENIDFTHNTEIVLNTFETTIRYLGGLLSSYELSDYQYPSLLRKAVELADILLMSFDTPNRLPVTRWTWRDSVHGHKLKASKRTLLAEFGSLDLEFTKLAQLTGDDKYFDAVERLTMVLQETQDKTLIPGLWPTIINAEQARMEYNHFTFGGMADSTYEYLPKQFMLLGGLDQKYRTMYDKAIDAAKKHIFYRPLVPGEDDILFSGNAALEKSGEVQTEPQGQHLTCFVGGMVAIAAKIFEKPMDIPVARRLVDGCVWAYNSTPTGLMPETFHMAPCHFGADPAIQTSCVWSKDKWYEAIARTRADNDNRTLGETLPEVGRALAKERALLPGYTVWGDNRYILRPEAIESVFIMYRLTGDPRFPEIAWKMFQSIEVACKTPIAYAAITDMRINPPIKQNRMESFWLAETLKYFYLIFAEPDEVSLDEWVLNTEAHPLRRPKSGEALSSKHRSA